MKEIQRQIHQSQMQPIPGCAMKWINASLLLWISTVALSAQSSTALETEKIRIRKPVIPDIWYSLSSEDEPKAIGPTVQIRPYSNRSDLELVFGASLLEDQYPDSADDQHHIDEDTQLNNGDSKSLKTGAPGSPGSVVIPRSEESSAATAEDIISVNEKPFVPTSGKLNGSNASAAFIPSGFAGSPSASGTASGSRPVAGGSLASGTSLGSSSSAGFGTSESSFEQENTSGSESGSSSSSSIDWSKNFQLNNSTLVAVGEGATLNIEGNVNLKKNQLGVSGAGNTDVTGKFVGLGTVRKSGSGVMTLYGKNSYNGNLIISEGTLLLGASNRLSDKIDVTLGGGSFNTSGFDENVGELTLTRDSIIDLGDGDSVLKFRDSSSSEWTSGEVVEIRNWSGAAGGGGQDQIYAGSSNRGLTEDQLKQIEFFDPFGENSGRFPARILPSGEIVPAPEPSTILAALGALGWIGFREKKRLLGWLKKFRSAG